MKQACSAEIFSGKERAQCSREAVRGKEFCAQHEAMQRKGYYVFRWNKVITLQRDEPANNPEDYGKNTTETPRKEY